MVTQSIPIVKKNKNNFRQQNKKNKKKNNTITIPTKKNQIKQLLDFYYHIVN